MDASRKPDFDSRFACGGGGGWPLFDNREGIAMEGASVSDRAKYIEREREQRGEGRRVSDSGIRQLGQAAWLEADLIVYSSIPSHSDTLQEEERASLSDNRPPTATHRQDLFIFNHYYILRVQSIGIFFVKQTDFLHH